MLVVLRTRMDQPCASPYTYSCRVSSGAKVPRTEEEDEQGGECEMSWYAVACKPNGLVRSGYGEEIGTRELGARESQL